MKKNKIKNEGKKIHDFKEAVGQWEFDIIACDFEEGKPNSEVISEFYQRMFDRFRHTGEPVHWRDERNADIWFGILRGD